MPVTIHRSGCDGWLPVRLWWTGKLVPGWKSTPLGMTTRLRMDVTAIQNTDPPFPRQSAFQFATDWASCSKCCFGKATLSCFGSPRPPHGRRHNRPSEIRSSASCNQDFRIGLARA